MIGTRGPHFSGKPMSRKDDQNDVSEITNGKASHARISA